MTDKKEAGYKNEHRLIEEKVIPESLVKLREELALPRNKDIFDVAIKGSNFAECLGLIAANLGIIVDGWYDISDLAGMLFRKLQERHCLIITVDKIDDGLIPALLKETSNSIEIHRTYDKFQRMMLEADCKQCDNKQACMMAKACLGDASTSDIRGLTRKQKQEFKI